jgi:hypothetical protein
LKKLVPVLEQIEREFGAEFHFQSGGFSEAVMYDYDDEIIDIEVKSGVQSDCDDRVYTDNIKIDRKTMKPIN